jgi:hypothetical protein
MRKVLTLVSIAAFLVLAGCVPSLQPLHTEEDGTSDPARTLSFHLRLSLGCLCGWILHFLLPGEISRGKGRYKRVGEQI